MRQVNIQEAVVYLSQLADEAAAGETIIIAREGKPVARLVPLAEAPADAAKEDVSSEEKPLEKKRRELGFFDGIYTVPDDFDTMCQDEIIAMFEGRE